MKVKIYKSRLKPVKNWNKMA